jgi:hypothetical protein
MPVDASTLTEFLAKLAVDHTELGIFKSDVGSYVNNLTLLPVPIRNALRAQDTASLNQTLKTEQQPPPGSTYCITFNDLTIVYTYTLSGCTRTTSEKGRSKMSRSRKATSIKRASKKRP